MNHARDASDVARLGHTTIVASMVVFVILLLTIWALIGFQIHRARKQHLADLETGAEVGPIDSDIPLDSVLKSKPVRVSKSSLGSWPATQETTQSSAQSSRSGVARDSQWYAEERPVRYFFHKIGKMLKNW
jgi:hypothetical protein